ncbi:maleylpyruvate isomerase N-terminal domain-containing protein [Amycolatopsis sp. NPDC051903]|uniref:maleylpyruvate isomerase N-terminal domain-containing protein n=1 Tax=Amycolatopsis sp. NPDC051903 TaxID=3363936 RepID=UPI0037BB1723
MLGSGMNHARWLNALNGSSARLSAIVADLPEDALRAESYATGWTVAQVLSHLGSAAEICSALVERGLAGDRTPPSADDTRPVWARWDAMSAEEQRSSWYEADRRHRDLLASAGETTVIPYFAGLLSVTEYAGYRLSEQSLHAWDIEVQTNPSATIPESNLLWERLDLVVTRFHNAEVKARLAPMRIGLPDAALVIDGEVHLEPADVTSPDAEIAGDRDAVLRLFYGRNRDADGLKVAGAAQLDDLRALFPGF